MRNTPAYLRLTFDPIADPAAVVIEGSVRFSVLTSRLIRMEYAPDGRFEDRPSQPFWYRHQPVPDYEVERSAEGLVLRTEFLELRYRDQSGGFESDSLAVTLVGDGTVWHYGDLDEGNLLGTTRTLDEVSGSTRLEPGLLSRAGWVVVDDSATLVFDPSGWLETRDAAPGTGDLYFFGYGHDYAACLRDYALVAGRAPLLPRWALGNWWSRYWAYTDEDLRRLIDDFRDHEVPLAVCIVDMDWHLVDVGRGVNGWTGYTWNRDLFPDPPGFVNWLHEQGLRTALNLHPALGIRAHEEAYPALARRVGLDPDGGETVPFDLADLNFTEAYFELLHHPREAEGVDFWWVDWQQGERSKLPGLDPLWWLNHLHYYDLGREGKRPFTFSRWGGLGNHRYPIGFSGDTQVTWESLAFQPYFTATAANVGYGWWSHDIGGHMQGVEDRELYTRWVQFGVFSPIFRLHSTNNPYHERRPWGYDAEVLHITRDAMQLRHALIPYLYTLSWLDETEGVAPIRPMYHSFPDSDEAYACPQQYMFGPDLIVAPYTSAADPDTRLARQVVWLPDGDWYDFFSGQHYMGNAWYALHGRLGDIPVFARAGSIVPLAPRVGWGGVEAPEALDIHCFAGVDGHFTLFEDSGESLDYRHGEYALTTVEQRWNESDLEIIIHPPAGADHYAPGKRRVQLHVVGVTGALEVKAQLGRDSVAVSSTYDAERAVLTLDAVEVPRGVELKINLRPSRNEPLLALPDRAAEAGLQLLETFRMESLAKAALAEVIGDVDKNPAILTAFDLEMTSSQTRAVLETMLGAGAHYVAGAHQPHLVVLWNNRGDPTIRYSYSAIDQEGWFRAERFRGEAGNVPGFLALSPQAAAWRVAVIYPEGNVFEVGYEAVA